MGNEADHLSEWAEEVEREERPARRKKRPRFTGTVQMRAQDHHPATDSDARALIKKLGTYVWDTHKVRGRFAHNPYHITATIDGVHHTIYLPGRFGTTLLWLKGKTEKCAH